MAWIEAHQNLIDHPKTCKAARALGIDPVHLLGHLFCLWWWALDYAQDGILTEFDVADIALAARWNGDAQVFFDALMNAGPGKKAGFLDRDGEDVVIHDWWDYVGRLLEKRRKDAARKRENRQQARKQILAAPTCQTLDNQTESDVGPVDVQRLRLGHPSDGASYQPTNPPTNPTTAPSDATVIDDGDEQSDGTPFSQTATHSTRRPRGQVATAMWSTFSEYLGFSPETDSERGKWNKGIGELQDAGVGEHDLSDLIYGYVHLLEYPECNPKSLAANLGKVRAARDDPQRTRRTPPNLRSDDQPRMSDVDAIITLEMGDRQGAYQSELERLAHAAGRTVWEQREYHKYLYLSDPTILNHIQRRMEHGEIPSEEIPRLAETTTFEEYLKPQKEVANL